MPVSAQPALALQDLAVACDLLCSPRGPAVNGPAFRVVNSPGREWPAVGLHICGESDAAFMRKRVYFPRFSASLHLCGGVPRRRSDNAQITKRRQVVCLLAAGICERFMIFPF